MPSARALAVLLLAPALAGCAEMIETADLAEEAVPGFDPLAFAGLHGPDEVAAIVESWSALSGVEVAEIGASVEGRPLHKVVLGRGPFEVWAVGRHHGNEPTGAEAILQVVPLLARDDVVLAPDAPPILRALRESRDLVLDRVTLVTVPLVNPDGAERFVRTNVNGQDLNRDYFLFKEPEPRAVRDAFWEHWPDACLDLHNEGESARFDYDAFVPVVFPEEEMQAELTSAAWRAVYEVDAAGGFGGGPNENYRLQDEGVGRQVVWPDALHPGTHDMFCSLRGAPGWTPEGAVPWASGEPSDDVHAYGWSTRLHAVTLASALLDAAGLYDGFAAPVVRKVEGTVGGLGADHLVDVPVEGELQIQVVWREPVSAAQAAIPVAVEVEEPTGRARLARMPHPEAFTATVAWERAEAGTYRVNVKGPPGTPYEVRMRLVPDEPAPVLVERTEGGLHVESRSPRPVRLVLTDVFDAAGADAAAFAPPPASVAVANGTIAPRALVEWRVDLPAFGTLDVAYPDGLKNPGPWRWFATRDDGRAATGVEAERSTQA